MKSVIHKNNMYHSTIGLTYPQGRLGAGGGSKPLPPIDAEKMWVISNIIHSMVSDSL